MAKPSAEIPAKPRALGFYWPRMVTRCRSKGAARHPWFRGAGGGLGSPYTKCKGRRFAGAIGHRRFCRSPPHRPRDRTAHHRNIRVRTTPSRHPAPTVGRTNGDASVAEPGTGFDRRTRGHAKRRRNSFRVPLHGGCPGVLNFGGMTSVSSATIAQPCRPLDGTEPVPPGG